MVWRVFLATGWRLTAAYVPKASRDSPGASWDEGERAGGRREGKRRGKIYRIDYAA
jgi:hypothetical protein